MSPTVTPHITSLFPCEPRTSHTRDKYSPTELQPRPSTLLLKTGFFVDLGPRLFGWTAWPVHLRVPPVSASGAGIRAFAILPGSLHQAQGLNSGPQAYQARILLTLPFPQPLDWYLLLQEVPMVLGPQGGSLCRSWRKSMLPSPHCVTAFLCSYQGGAAL